MEFFENRLGATDFWTREALYWLSAITQRMGKIDASLGEKLLASTILAKGPDHVSTLNAMRTLADTLKAAGQMDVAETLLRDAINKAKSRPGGMDIDTLYLYGSLGDVLHKREEFREVEDCLRRAWLGIVEVQLRPSVEPLSCLTYLADTIHKQGRLDESFELFDQALAGFGKLFGPDQDHPKIAWCKGMKDEAVLRSTGSAEQYLENSANSDVTTESQPNTAGPNELIMQQDQKGQSPVTNETVR